MANGNPFLLNRGLQEKGRIPQTRSIDSPFRAPRPSGGGAAQPASGGGGGGGRSDFLDALLIGPGRFAQQQRVGAGRSAFIEQMQKSIAAGVPPRRAALAALNSEAAEDFLSSPTFNDDLAQIQEMMAGPQPELEGVSPGETLVQVGPEGAQELFRAPTKEAQQARDILALQNAGQDEQAAILQAMTLSGGTAKERAVSRLIESGVISQEVGDKIVGGVFQVTPARNEFGDQIGTVVTDLSAGQSGLMSPTGAAGAGQLQPEREERRPLPGEEAQGRFGKAELFLGAGLAPAALSFVGSVARQVDPTIQLGLSDASRRDYLNQLKTRVLGLRENRSTFNIPVRVIERLDALVPSTGIFQDPGSALIRGIRLRRLLEEQIAEADQIIASPSTSQEANQAAEGRRIQYQSFLELLPEEDQMFGLFDALQQGEALADTPASVLEELQELRQRMNGEPEPREETAPVKQQARGPQRPTTRQEAVQFVEDTSSEDLTKLARDDPQEFQRLKRLIQGQQ